ncbi:MAG: AAA family ATPase [Mycobacterium sp.]|nr:AAA family ATPase [Thermomicrobiales bacterium]MCB0932672.1 AAA family ATPase [Mycobacterium sp.]
MEINAAAGAPAGVSVWPEPDANKIAETHTGLVFLVGDRAYKVKKPVATDFLDFTSAASRELACAHEVELNRRLAPRSYLGVAHFTLVGETPEPVIVMRRHPDARRLATMVRRGEPLDEPLADIALLLARFHAGAHRGPDVDEQARADAVAARWQENLAELAGYARGRVPGLDPAAVTETARLAEGFIAGRSDLFDRRIAEGRIVDGHADLLADDIFCMPEGPALLDCLEFDDRLRYVDVADDLAFLAMDLEFLGRPDLAEVFASRYAQFSGDDAPVALRHFYIAYRAGVRAKVDCVRYTQGRAESALDAQRHLDIALSHLRAGAVRLILVGGGPGTGKTTVAGALAESLAKSTVTQVISTDDVRAELVRRGELTGEPGVLGQGLYSRENVDAVYDEVLRQARGGLREGRSVILDGTWRDEGYRERARRLAAETSATMVELACVAALDASITRIRSRTESSSQVTPEIATALADHPGTGAWPGAHPIDTTRELAESIAEATEVCLTAQNPVAQKTSRPNEPTR